MKPTNFKQQNTVYKAPDGMTEEECGALPAFKYEAGVISCWKLSFRERLKCLFTGKVWLDVLMRGQPPVWLGVDAPFISAKED